nr:hypothetical protein [Bacillus pumilus]
MFRYWVLTIYVVVSFCKSLRHLHAHELTDPRISYTKRMHLIHEHAKRFARGCIDQSGSVMTIHRTKEAARWTRYLYHTGTESSHDDIIDWSP